MREEYDTNREERYYSIVDRGGKKEKVVEPYQKVRDRIKRVLESRASRKSFVSGERNCWAAGILR